MRPVLETIKKVAILSETPIRRSGLAKSPPVEIYDAFQGEDHFTKNHQCTVSGYA